ncbi:MAG: transposase [bacterium]
MTARGIARRAIFDDDASYLRLLELLSKLPERLAVRVHAYALMPNHVHLVLETPEGNLSQAMQWLKTSYAMWFNRRRRRVGPLFQGRYHAVLFEGPGEAWGITRYVHLNPVQVKSLGLGKSDRRLESLGLKSPGRELAARRVKVLRQFRWSSYACYIGRKPVPSWLTVEPVLGVGAGGNPAEQRRAYRLHVERLLGEPRIENPIEDAVAGLLKGNADWIDRLRRMAKGDRLEQKAVRKLTVRPDWPDICSVVERVKGEKWDRFVDRHGDWGRDLALYLARQYGGISLRTLTSKIGGTNYYAAAQAIARFRRRADRDRGAAAGLEEALKCMKIQT